MKLFKQLLLTAFFLVPVLAHGQKCKFDKDETDGFTNERVRTSNIRLGKIPLWWLIMEQTGNKYYFTYYLNVLKEVRDIMPKGTKILTKLENGTIIELETEQDIIPTHNVEGTVIVTCWKPKIEVSAEKMKLFSSSPAELLRTTISEQPTEPRELKGKQGEKIKDIATCLLKKD